MNFVYDDIVHVLQNTIDSCINSATDRRGYVLECMFTKFSEITQYNGHYVVQGHSADFGTNRKIIYDFLLVINTNLPPIFHRFRDIASERSKSLHFSTTLWFNPSTEGFPWDDLRKILPGCWQVTNVLNGAEILPKISIGWVGCTNVTDRRQTDGWTTTYSEHEHEFTFAKNWISSYWLPTITCQN